MIKKLVAYFSAEGNTEKVAKKIASAASADIFEIKPQTPYTKSDINWKNPLSRCNKEKIGGKDVPVSDRINNIEQYDLIFLGFPIWYYSAPNIIKTFLKSYDLSGKNIVLFATSGGSGINKCADKLKPFLSGTAQIIASKLLSVSDSEESIKACTDSI